MSMRRWEEERRNKVHLEKVRNAKPVVKTGVKETASPSLHTQKGSVDFAPLKQLLKNFNLQQYFLKLTDEGFDDSYSRLAYMSQPDYNELLDRLKVMPGHRKRFDDLVEFLRQMSTCSEPLKGNRKYADNRSQTAGIMSYNSPEATQLVSTMRTLSLFSQREAALQSGSIEEQDEVELDASMQHSNMNSTQPISEYDDSSVSSSLSTAEALKLKQELAEAKAKINALQAELQKKHPDESNEFASERDLHRYREAIYVEEPDFAAEPIRVESNVSYEPTDSYESVTLVNPFEEAKAKEDEGYVPPDTPALLSNPRTSVVRRSSDLASFKVTAPVAAVFGECQDNKQIDREEVGRSYDSWKMRSTLVNLDIEEMCRCLSKVIHRHIEYSATLPNKIDHSLPDFLDEMRKPSMASSESLNYSAESMMYIEPLCRMFERAFNDPTGNAAVPDESAIYNYSKNVILRSKMEKEASIICLVYLERLIIRAGLRINSLNWKRLLFTSLVLASKIWDDESFENKHFAQVFTMFTQEEINTMESVFLTILDYRLIVAGSDYANYYLILRTYAERQQRSFPLRALDVDTVRKLQNTCTRAETSFREMYRDALYKTM
mmetsp:Transcript_13228/g.24778  ORF Transcript_13228/g.24778 Transcript_13228/m.24778 type:complete len:606 (-) Transcript_13228:2204-4021(-)